MRRGQLVTTYGVGAIVAVEDESFMVAGIDKWTVSEPNLHEPRLEAKLKVAGFVLPPATEDGCDIPVIRFPTMVSCSECKRLASHRSFTAFDSNRCPDCEKDLVPSRFVMACSRGHIDDFPYHRWLHQGSANPAPHDMRMEAGGETASLRAILLSCSCGVEPKTLEGAFGKHALKGITKCTGRRPWLGGGLEDCDQIPRTLQRGASNVWFSAVASALSIPPWSEAVFRYLNKFWPMLKHLPDDAASGAIADMGLPQKSGFRLTDFSEAIRQRKLSDEGADTDIDQSARLQELEALLKGRPEDASRPDFVCVPASRIGKVSSNWIDRVMLVKRLREVRALTGFTRIVPSNGADQTTLASLYSTHPGWLPAIEVLGEGVFMTLRQDRLAGWAKNEVIRDRAAKLNKQYAKRFTGLGQKPDRVISPRFILAHTFAHSLINQWSLDCGYPTSSLRERLYVMDDRTGVLIYTATTDSAGSLGGVIAQADPTRLDESIQGAISRVAWCSADPLCVEADASGVDSQNLAACHACVLLPEVSCEEFNVLLDRAMLVGLPSDPAIGFFAAN